MQQQPTGPALSPPQVFSPYLTLAPMAGLDNLTDADRKHLAPFLYQGATFARSTVLQYVKSDPVSKKDRQGPRNPCGICVRETPGRRPRERAPTVPGSCAHIRQHPGCSAACSAHSTTSWGSSQTTVCSTIANAPAPNVRTAAIECLKGRVPKVPNSAGGSGGGGAGGGSSSGKRKHSTTAGGGWNKVARAKCTMHNAQCTQVRAQPPASLCGTRVPLPHMCGQGACMGLSLPACGVVARGSRCAGVGA